METLRRTPRLPSLGAFGSLVIALAVALGFSGCKKKSDPLISAQIFMNQIANGQAQAAYESSAFSFQVQRSAAVFEKAAQEMGLTDATGTQWDKPEVNGRNATVGVRVQTRAGQQLPLIVTLIDESGAWRVYSLRSPPSEQTGVSENRFTLVGKAPSFSDAVTQPVPPETELRLLVRENLLRFNDAITTKSFDAFYDSVSRKWQDQLTKGQLQRAFQPFIDKHVNIRDVEKVDPVWEAPVSVSTEGLLVLSGYYPTEPYRVHFAMKFLYELPSWKLFGLDVNLWK